MRHTFGEAALFQRPASIPAQGIYPIRTRFTGSSCSARALIPLPIALRPDSVYTVRVPSFGRSPSVILALAEKVTEAACRPPFRRGGGRGRRQ